MEEPCTAADNEALLRLRKEGDNYSITAARLGRIRESVRKQENALRCSAPNAARRHWTGEEEQLLLKLAGEGLSHVAMADQLRRNTSMIGNM